MGLSSWHSPNGGQFGFPRILKDHRSSVGLAAAWIVPRKSTTCPWQGCLFAGPQHRHRHLMQLRLPKFAQDNYLCFWRYNIEYGSILNMSFVKTHLGLTQLHQCSHCLCSTTPLLRVELLPGYARFTQSQPRLPERLQNSQTHTAKYCFCLGCPLCTSPTILLLLHSYSPFIGISNLTLS